VGFFILKLRERRSDVLHREDRKEVAAARERLREADAADALKPRRRRQAVAIREAAYDGRHRSPVRKSLRRNDRRSQLGINPGRRQSEVPVPRWSREQLRLNTLAARGRHVEYDTR